MLEKKRRGVFFDVRARTLSFHRLFGFAGEEKEEGEEKEGEEGDGILQEVGACMHRCILPHSNRMTCVFVRMYIYRQAQTGAYICVHISTHISHIHIPSNRNIGFSRKQGMCIHACAGSQKHRI